MSFSTNLTAEEQNTLVTLLGALPDARMQVSAPDCNTYKTYRSLLQTALPIIAKIPAIGSKAANAITFLMQIADSVCQVSVHAEAPAVKVEKTGDNQVTVTFPPGTKIGAGPISEADLYFALNRDLLKVSSKPNPAN